MELYGIGNALFYYREKKGLSQEQVCEGICTRMTISRIETGAREVDSLMSESLLERIGKSANRFEFVLNEEDYHLYILREAIKKAVDEQKPEEAKLNLEEYKKQMPEEQVLHQQFVKYYEALVLQLENGKTADIVQLLYEAINLTRADFKDRTNNIILYSSLEIHIIYQLFLYEGYTEDELYPVLHFLDEMYDDKEKGAFLIPFLNLFVKRYEAEGNYHGMEKIAGKAIDILQKGRSYIYLTDLYFARIRAQEQIGRLSEEWNHRRNELIIRCYDLYYMYMIDENEGMMNTVAEFCKERLGCQIIM